MSLLELFFFFFTIKQLPAAAGNKADEIKTVNLRAGKKQNSELKNAKTGRADGNCRLA